MLSILDAEVGSLPVMTSRVHDYRFLSRNCLRGDVPIKKKNHHIMKCHYKHDFTLVVNFLSKSREYIVRLVPTGGGGVVKLARKSFTTLPSFTLALVLSCEDRACSSQPQNFGNGSLNFTHAALPCNF